MKTYRFHDKALVVAFTAQEVKQLLEKLRGERNGVRDTNTLLAAKQKLEDAKNASSIV